MTETTAPQSPITLHTKEGQYSTVLADGRVFLETIEGGVRYSVYLARSGEPVASTYKVETL